jgi:hypothetical protein
MPDRSGYQALSASEPEGDEDGNLGMHASTAQPRGRTRRPRMGSVDLSSLDSAFKQWTGAIASRLKLQKKTKEGPSKKHIWRSVFEPIGVQTVDLNPKTLDHKPPMTQTEFDA